MTLVIECEQATCKAGVEVLQTCSGKVEEAVKELLHMIRSAALFPSPSPTDSDDIAKSKAGVFSSHHQLLLRMCYLPSIRGVGAV